MIKEIQGDILTNNCLNKKIYVCHQVNCKGVMGAGLARQIKETFPELYKKYRLDCFNKNMLGEITTYKKDNMVICNIFGQYGFGRDKSYTDYEALKKAFTKLNEHLEKQKNCILRFPYKFGSGLAGGNWEVIRKLIEDFFPKINIEIWELV